MLSNVETKTVWVRLEPFYKSAKSLNHLRERVLYTIKVREVCVLVLRNKITTTKTKKDSDIYLHRLFTFLVYFRVQTSENQ